MAAPMTEYELEALPELEGEYEGEYEDEGEEFLSTIARGIGGLLSEGEGEYEDEYEGEYEDEYEGEYESEEFFRQIAALARRGMQSPTLQRLGRMARSAAMAGRIAGLTMNPLPMPAVPQEPPAIVAVQEPRRRGGMQQRPPQREYESEWEEEVNPQQRAYSGALMEHLAHAAATTESEAEAEAFIGALVPLAARLLPRAAPALLRAAPNLVRGLAGATRVLRRNPATRPLVRTLPTVLRRTAANVARQTAQGRPVTPQRAVQTLARQTAQVIGSPRQCVQAYQRGRTLDRQYHRMAGNAARPQAARRQSGCPTCGSQKEW